MQVLVPFNLYIFFESNCLHNPHKELFITPEEALKKVENRSNEWKKYKEEVIIGLTKRVYRHEEEYAKKLVEDCELEIFKDYFLKDETADGCAALMGYGCG